MREHNAVTDDFTCKSIKEPLSNKICMKMYSIHEDYGRQGTMMRVDLGTQNESA